MMEEYIEEVPLEELLANSEYAKNRVKEMPVWEKPLLTVVEAAKYFQIGELNIRRLTQEQKEEDFIFWRDSHVFIRREKFEDFLNRTNAI